MAMDKHSSLFGPVLGDEGMNIYSYSQNIFPAKNKFFLFPQKLEKKTKTFSTN
jgi:hypothetical protein